MKRLLHTTMLIVALFVVLPAIAVEDKNEKPFVVPELREWNGGNGIAEITKKTRIVYPKGDSALKAVAQQLANDYGKMFGTELQVTDKAAKNGDITLSYTNDKTLGEEGYTIAIDNNIELSAPTAKGLFWATRTILQIAEQSKGKSIAKGTIRDWPDYSLRGFMLDCGRKFIPLHFLYDYVKLMSYYKMNTFQIHLNDNSFKQYFNNDWNKTQSAFRLESDYFPGLTARDGYYTKQEFIELQKFAEEMHVEIIPEIDAPAHSLAFTKFRPEIGSKEYGMDHLDLFKNETYTFIDSLYDEYLKGDEPVFRGKRVHVGTDEYSNRDKAVVEKFRYFTDYCIRLVEKYGKQACAWGALTHAKGETPVKSENVLLGAWYNGYADPKDMIELGYDIISIPDGYLYIVPAAGYYYDYLNTQMLYEHWTPAQIGNQKFEERHPQIKGGMFAVWNDHAGNGISYQDIHYRAFPAMQTMAVKMWTGAAPALKYDEFSNKLQYLSEAPGVNVAGRTNSYDENGTRIPYSFSKKVVKPGESMGVKEIGWEYSVSFDIEAAKEDAGTILFESENAKFYLSDPVEGKIGFSRDGYLNTFNYQLFPGEKAKITVSGNKEQTSLYIDGKLIETLDRETQYHHNSASGNYDKMYYVRTLVFPLQKTGAFKSKISNLEVTDKCL